MSYVKHKSVTYWNVFLPAYAVRVYKRVRKPVSCSLVKYTSNQYAERFKSVWRRRRKNLWRIVRNRIGAIWIFYLTELEYSENGLRLQPNSNPFLETEYDLQI